jgi:hypothetical protein
MLFALVYENLGLRMGKLCPVNMWCSHKIWHFKFISGNKNNLNWREHDFSETCRLSLAD